MPTRPSPGSSGWRGCARTRTDDRGGAQTTGAKPESRMRSSRESASLRSGWAPVGALPALVRAVGASGRVAPGGAPWPTPIESEVHPGALLALAPTTLVKGLRNARTRLISAIASRMASSSLSASRVTVVAR